jgi:hypothetical protein
MRVFVHHHPQWGKYAVFEDGSRAPMPREELDEETLQRNWERNARIRRNALYAVAPRLFRPEFN